MSELVRPNKPAIVGELEQQRDRAVAEAKRLRWFLSRIAALTRGRARPMAVSALRGDKPREPRRKEP